MVSGFLTSPCDQVRMSSALARPMRNSSKKLTSSKTLPALSGFSWCVSLCSPIREAGQLVPTPRPASDLFDAAGLAPGQVDAQLLGRPEDVLVGVAHLDRHTVAGEHLDVEAQRLHLLDQHLERLRNARLGNVFALDDGLVDLDPAEDVVGLDRQQLLQGVRSAVRLQRPDLHLAEALASELRLTAQRLLCDH